MAAVQSSVNVLKLCLVIVCAATVTSVSAETIVCLRSHKKQCIQGVEKVTSLAVKYEAFMGIPYAKPPVGLLRFANPVPNDKWTGIYNASQPKKSCIQWNEYLPQLGAVLGNEDCLYLNVYRPRKAAHNLPVLVYIHGGQFQSGSVNPSYSGPEKFMNSRDAILVTVAYRLGALGFLSTGDSSAPGNFGLKDQSMAIRWVRKHISKFGGDRELITLFGDGTGAAAVQYHMMSPLSRGHFSRAIMMSGSALSLFARPEPDPMRLARVQAQILGLTSYASATRLELVTYLRNIPAAQLVASFDDVKQADGITQSTTIIFRPVIEQHVEGQSFLHESPLTLWETGNYEQIPWMAGHVPIEGIIFARDYVEAAMDPILWADLIANAPSNVAATLWLDLPAVTPILQRFYGGADLASLSPAEIILQSINTITEVQFEYPLMKSVTQHLQHANSFNAPVSVYFMNFTGPYSVSSIILPGSSYPVVHSDDLQYVFSRPSLFPEFAYGSPAYLVAQKMVKLFVEFARTGRPLPSFLGTCPSENHCKQIEFCNDPFGFDVQLTDAIDSELLTFWDDLYNNYGSGSY